jgi:hypothetical protein
MVLWRAWSTRGALLASEGPLKRRSSLLIVLLRRRSSLLELGQGSKVIGSKHLSLDLSEVPPPTPPRLGGLCQARVRRSHAGVAVPRSLYPSRGHFQSSIVGFRTRARDFPLEGVRPWRQARSDGAGRHQIPASLLSARATQRPRLHSSLRVSDPSLSCYPPRPVPPAVGPTTMLVQSGPTGLRLPMLQCRRQFR